MAKNLRIILDKEVQTIEEAEALYEQLLNYIKPAEPITKDGRVIEITKLE